MLTLLLEDSLLHLLYPAVRAEAHCHRLAGQRLDKQLRTIRPEQAVAWQHGGFQGGQLAWHSAQRCYQLRQGHGTRAHARSLQSTGLQACCSSMAPNSLQAYYSQTTPNSIAPACNWQVWQLGKEAVAGNGLVSLPQHSFATRVPQAHFSGRASQHWRDVGGHMRAASRLGHWKHHVAAVGQANGDLPGREQCRSSET